MYFAVLYICSKIIWLGDLNYRLTSPCDDTHKLLESNDWQALVEKDQVEFQSYQNDFMKVVF